MKILFKDKIVESYRFPLSEAISFSILIWTLWGLAEAFYWHTLLPFLDVDAARLDSRIFLAAFAVYLALASLVAILSYVGWFFVLMFTHKYEAYRFRGLTLSTVLGVFFFVVLNYNLRKYLLGSSLDKNWQHAICAITIILAVAITVLLYFRASRVGFRIRRPGATMLSVFILSVMFSFVAFPVFSKQKSPHEHQDFRSSADRIMACHYLQQMIGKSQG